MKKLGTKSFLKSTFKREVRKRIGYTSIVWKAPDVVYIWHKHRDHILWRRINANNLLEILYDRIYLGDLTTNLVPVTEDRVFEIIKEHYENIGYKEVS